jgi:hypothetical protein
MAEDPGRQGSEAEGAYEPDPLRRLERRLDQASAAAERLIAEAASAAVKRPPPSGWQPPEPEGGHTEGTTAVGGDIDLLLDALRSLRDRIPPDLQRRLGEALRELLMALRALIDWYLERTERRRREPAEVQDIPIL